MASRPPPDRLVRAQDGRGRRARVTGLVGPRPLTRREMEIYLWLVHETMSVAEILAAQIQAIDVIANNPIDSAIDK
jgi:hypothetical protein